MSKRRRSSGSRRAAEAKFWGSPVAAAHDGDSAADAGAPGGDGRAILSILPTPDPGALVRSLGPAPLAVDPGLAERHLTAVYEEAVRAATALAAANGLLAEDRDDS
jgi:hypothetical protein